MARVARVSGFVAAGLCLAFGVNEVSAASGTWTGAEDVYWTNSANWGVSPFPSGNETATFTGAGNGNTALNLAGLSGIQFITFDTAGVAPYVLGAGPANSQTNILRDGGEILLTSSAGNSQSFNATVRLGPDGTTASYSIRNNHAGQTLSFADIAGMSGGTKTLTFNGAGPVSVNGRLDRGGSALDVYLNGVGALALNGNSSMRLLQMNADGGVVNLGAGTTMTVSNGGGNGIMAAQDCTINGPGVIFLSTTGGDGHLDNGAETGKTLTINAKLTGATGFEFWHNTYRGTIALMNPANDYTLSTIINVAGTIRFEKLANRLVACGLGAGTNIVLNAVGARYLYTGTGDTSDRLVDVRTGGIIEQGGTGLLKFTSATASTSTGAKTLVLQGSTEGTGEFSGAVVNGSGTVSLTKAGTGLWTLSGNSTYSGATVINGGTLALSGTAGAAASSTSYAVNSNATLRVVNSASANNGNRLRDASPVTLGGATLAFEHSGGAVNYSETIGVVTLTAGANTIAVSQADSGQTSSVTLSGLICLGGTVNFSGSGLGESGRNRVFITGYPNGVLGGWATVNGSPAAYSSARGIYAADEGSVTDIAARGPTSVIPDDDAVTARINTPGEDGPITLAGATVTRVFGVVQNTDTPAVIQTRDGAVDKALQTAVLKINAGQAALTLGEAPGEGSVAALDAGGNLMLQNEDASAVLTLNAPVVNNGTASMLSKDGQGKVLLVASNSYSGVTAIYQGALTVGGASTQTLSGVISGPGALAKEGSGQLTLSGNNTYMGPTTVSAGTIVVQNSNALGDKGAGTVVASGGALDLGGTLGAQGLNLGAEMITVSGSGADGRGALVNNSNTSQYNALRFVTLAGDTTFGGAQSGGRWDIRNTATPSTLEMNGYTLTKKGPNMVGLTGVTVTPGAGNIDIQEGTFTVEAGTTLGGSAANVMTVRSGAIFDIWRLTTPVMWSLVMENNSRFYARDGNVTNQNIWAGPVTLNGRAVFDAAGTFSSTVSGPISGPGSVVKTTANSTTYFLNPANTYEGGTIISNGILYARTPGSLPGYNDGRLTVAGGGTLAVHAFDGGVVGWTADQIRDLNLASSFLADNAVLSIDTTLTGFEMPHNLPNRMGLTKLGPNRMTLSGINEYRGDTRVQGGEFVITASGTHRLGMVVANTASIMLTNATGMAIDVTNKSCYIGDDAGRFAVMTVGGKTTWGSWLAGNNVSGPTLVIGQRGNAILHLRDEAVITNRLYLGNETSGAGAVYQSGSSRMHNWCGASSDGRIGMSGYGYYELNSGTFTNNGYFHLGRDRAAVGFLYQTGGAFEQGTVFGGQLGLSRGGTGVVYTAGGTFVTASGLNVGESSDNGASTGYAVFTADGNADVRISGTINMTDRTNMFAVVNLNGGTVLANTLSKSSARTGSVAIVNFNGGTLRARAAGNIIGAGANAPDRVDIYSGGAVIDTTNQVCTLAVPLRAPEGNGVASIGVTPRGGYIGPPMVTITGGGGTGATAIAQFDSASGTVTGIKVTSAGFGYTSAPTVTLSGGGTNVQTAVTGVTLAANVSGGLTKLGSGSLALASTNTYAGATVISNGTLFIGLPQSLPTGTDIALAGGTLSMGGHVLTNGTVTVTGGSLVNGVLNAGSFTKIGSDTAFLSATVASAAPVVISSGTVRLVGAGPGLYEGRVLGNINTSDPNPKSQTTLSPRYADIVFGSNAASGGIWVDNSTYVYTGFIWNRGQNNVTWTFAENFDDNVILYIDGQTVLNNNGWNVPSIGTVTLTPGAHAFEARFGQGGGGVGPVNGSTTTPTSWWTTTAFGFGIDFSGRNSTEIGNYQPLVDPGDGSLLTLTAAGATPVNLFDPATSLQIASGAVLDLDTYSQTFDVVSGGGAVSNGTMMVTGALSPGGDGTIGTFTVASSIELSGTLRVDVDAEGNSDRLAVGGSLSLNGAARLEVVNPASLNRQKTYTIATCGVPVNGAFASTNLPDNRWMVKYGEDGSVRLVFLNGFIMMLK